MPLQNRVAPDGSLQADTTRGMFTGNRGIIHDPDTRRLGGRRWTTRAWICCSLKFKDWKREVWGRNFVGKAGPAAGWSELFFLDEVTALAAGHRPCFTCRRAAAIEYGCAFDEANGTAGGGAPARDRILHGERWTSAGARRQALSPIDLAGLPDGAVLLAGGAGGKGRFLAIRNRAALSWNGSGYGPACSFGELSREPMWLVTPRASLGALHGGFRPIWHESAG